MRRTRVLGLVVSGVAVLAVGCGTEQAPRAGSGAGSTTPATTPTSAGSSSIPPLPSASPTPTPLAAAEARWKSKSLTSYSFIYEPNCFCVRTKLLVTVVDGAVISVKAAPGQENIGEPHVPAVGDAPSVEKLFADLHRAYDDAKPAADVQVTYDAEYGFPATAFIDWDTAMADEETGYTVSELAATPTVDVVGTWKPKKDNGAFITFDADGSYVGSDGCNGASGTWSLGSGKLVITTGMHTEIACDNQALDEWIATADSVTVAGDTMTIGDGKGAQVLTRTP